MFGLLHNLFKYVKVSRERRITFVVLGLDAAGKTTLLNTLKGELGKEVAPTFGFKTEVSRVNLLPPPPTQPSTTSSHIAAGMQWRSNARVKGGRLGTSLAAVKVQGLSSCV